eukprot:TRINITY_DN0_c1164_g1_i5.p1 TRINITY_DN0_c1164_g1~~TRINITY_DN0_c1164_g1_i5.p1  ORF type:complete len:367 (+),score=68.82 TRINITY_DN0_c1164_g1_i5:130-1101(+)
MVDKQEYATVLGWKVVVQKGEFKPGDLCIYYTLMSVLDDSNPDFDVSKDKNGRVKPIKSKKIRGVLSQGLITNLNVVKFYGADPAKLKEGDDVTELLKVKKYVEQEEASVYGGSKGDDKFPRFLPKTDEERIQNMPKVLGKLADTEVVITRKEDGTSCTYVFNEGKFLICSRNKIRNSEGSAKSDWYIAMAKKFDIKNNMTAYGKNIGVQGEIVGPGIGKNRLGLKDKDFRVFNVYLIDENRYATYDECEEIRKALKLNGVPLLYRGKFGDKWNTVDKIMAYAESIEYSEGVCAEGIVVKNNEIKNRISFKVVSNRYLLKHNQ